MHRGFVHKQYIFPGSIEHEYYFNGNYGKAGEKRAPKRKKTPEEIRAVNQSNREKRVRHLIKQNFKAGDRFITLNFSNDYKKRSLDSLRKKEIRNFLTRLRREYQKAGIPFKFIIRIERGAEANRPHIHIIMNRIPDIDDLVKKHWIYGGKMGPHFEIIDDDAETPIRLAEYVTKLTKEQSERIEATCNGDESQYMMYSCSRNLERPIPKKTIVSSRDMRSVFNHDLVPKKGFSIDKNPKTLQIGINPYTGLSYMKYQEIRLKPKQEPELVKLYECPICHQLAFEGLTCNCQRKHGHKRLRR